MSIEEDLRSLPREELEQRFMRTLIWYHSEKRWPTGFMNAIPARTEEIAKQLGDLNKQLAEGSKSQQRLATALNVLTFMLVMVGAVQIYLRF